MKYINMKNPLIFQKLIYFGQIKSDIFHSTDMLWRSKFLRIPIGPLLYPFPSKTNQNRGPNPIFSSPNYTKSVFSPKTRLVWFDGQFPKVNDTHPKLGTLSEPQHKLFYICFCSGPLCKRNWFIYGNSGVRGLKGNVGVVKLVLLPIFLKNDQ